MVYVRFTKLKLHIFKECLRFYGHRGSSSLKGLVKTKKYIIMYQ